jgi:hypothetical protein
MRNGDGNKRKEPQRIAKHIQAMSARCKSDANPQHLALQPGGHLLAFAGSPTCQGRASQAISGAHGSIMANADRTHDSIPAGADHVQTAMQNAACC